MIHMHASCSLMNFPLCFASSTDWYILSNLSSTCHPHRLGCFCIVASVRIMPSWRFLWFSCYDPPAFFTIISFNRTIGVIFRCAVRKDSTAMKDSCQRLVEDGTNTCVLIMNCTNRRPRGHLQPVLFCSQQTSLSWTTLLLLSMNPSDKISIFQCELRKNKTNCEYGTNW